MKATKAKSRVMLVDDESHVLDAVCLAIETQDDMEVSGRLSRADYLVDAAWESKPDVIVLDLSMPGVDPLHAMRALFTARPDAKVLVLSAFDDSSIIDRVIEAGAWGFVSKHSEPATVLEAIRKVARGDLVIPAAA